MVQNSRSVAAAWPFLLGLALIAISCGATSCSGRGGPDWTPSAHAQAGVQPSASPSVTSTPTASPTSVTFTQINQNILQPSCVSCHSGSSSPGGVDLSSYAGVSAQVVSGNPGQSRLYQAVSNGTMPPGGALSQDKIQQISDWITAGAKND
jgi:mono/diheme cytochrome c family protein